MALGKITSGVFGILWLILDGLRKVLHLVLLLFIFALLIAVLRTSAPVVPKSAALIVNPQGQIVEQLTGDPLERAFSRAASTYAPETQLRDILEALEFAATDERIKLVVLDLEQMDGAGLNKLQEIGAALTTFRASGKKVIAISDFYRQPDYYLAAHADEVYVDPLGGVLIEGFGRYQLYFKEALEKLGVDFNVFKVGTYKSFTEIFTRENMSPEEREQSLTWLDKLWSAYQADVTRARGLEADALGQYVAQAVPLMQAAEGDAARIAFERKLVSAVRTRAELNEELIQIVGEDEGAHRFNAVELEDYVRIARAQRAFKRGTDRAVGIVVAAGEILDGPQPPGTVGSDTLVRLIRDAREDESIEALVLRVDSPGGSMLASEQIYRELQAFAQAGKPVVASMSSVAASGGYYISLGAEEIWASPVTLTGSIGVFAAVPTFQNTLKKLGVSADGVGTTALSGQMRLDRPLGAQTRVLLQTSVEHAYREFLARVAAHREKTPAAIDAVAQGRVWAGEDAKTHGLIDGLGDLNAAIEAAATRAELGEDYAVRYLEPRITWQESLALELRATLARIVGAFGLTRLIDRVQPHALVREVADPLERELARWARFNDRRGLYAYCFCMAP